MRRWHSHGWNTATSLRLILTIIPRVPRPLVPALGVVTTAICLAYMKRERRAARRNLRRILGRGGFALCVAVWSLFYNFSRFMVGYCDLLRASASALEARVAWDLAGEARIREALARGRGVLVLTAHFGNWEIGTRLLERFGAPVNVAMRVERGNAAERWLARMRTRGSIRILRLGESPESILALRGALERNEILAMQGDRALGGRTLRVRLFGGPFDLPMGPFLLAQLCGATLLPAFVLQEGWGRWRSEIGRPVGFSAAAPREQALAAAASEYAERLESVVARRPDQWFNFYDLWPGDER